jgi:citrate synthase
MADTEMAKAQLTVGETVYELPVVIGSENETGLDIRKLRAETGLVTLDNGFISTASCSSGITFLNGEKGELRYRGYPIEQLAEHGDFVETAYCLIYGELPSQSQQDEFSGLIRDNSILNDEIRQLIENFPKSAHPMASMSAVICALSSVYPAVAHDEPTERELICRLMAQISTVAAAFYKRSIKAEMVEPDPKLSYIGNFMRMMFGKAGEDYKVDPDIEEALDMLLILHADHEQNCSTSAVRLVGSSQANIFATISGGINALSGPLHGGANQAVIEMLQKIAEDGGDYKKYVTLAKDKNSSFRLMGFGHRVYKNFDPRARIIKKAASKVLDSLGIEDPLLEIARDLEKVALEDEYFVKRRLYPNVDFYSGIIYRALDIPTDMFTVMFAIGRLPGWIAQWKEMNADPAARIGRPRQIYIGSQSRDYKAIDQRG